MNYATCVLFLVKRLKYHVVTSLLLILNELKFVIPVFNHQRIRLFTDFALKGLPKVRAEVWQYFVLTLHLKPALEA